MIRSFTGKYRFLSNFHPAPIVFEGIIYPTLEHAYQAAKTLDQERRKAIAALATPGMAKRAGKRVVLRLDWLDQRMPVMEQLVRQKFTDPGLLEMLIETYPQELLEGNTWGDTFWGVNEKGVGSNHLGKILMRVRAGEV